MAQATRNRVKGTWYLFAARRVIYRPHSANSCFACFTLVGEIFSPEISRAISFTRLSRASSATDIFTAPRVVDFSIKKWTSAKLATCGR